MHFDTPETNEAWQITSLFNEPYEVVVLLYGIDNITILLYIHVQTISDFIKKNLNLSSLLWTSNPANLSYPILHENFETNLYEYDNISYRLQLM